MKLRTRLTIVFSLQVAILLIVFSVFIYYSSEDFRAEQFRERLRDKANSTAKLLIEVQEVDLQLLAIIDRNTRTLINEFVCIFDKKGEMLYASYPDKPEIDALKVFIPEIQQEKEYNFSYKNKEAIGIVFTSGIDDYYVIASASDMYGIGKMTYLKWLLLFSFSASIIIIIISAMVFSKQALSPIAHVISQMAKISASNLNSRLNQRKSKDEIQYLTNTFNQMLDRIEEAFELQKNFVRDASHELRTPLTSVTSQIDVALLKERDSNEYRETLQSVREDIAKMNSMVNGLLQLAQSFTDLHRITTLPLRIDELIFECQKDMQKIHPDLSVNIQWERFPDSEEECYVNGNEQLLKTLFVNLTDNAYKFSDNKKVNITLRFDDTRFIVLFSNTGKAVDTGEQHRVFEPFYRGINSYTTTGSGIGLSLVKRIIDFHKGTVMYESKPPGETSVTVTLPKAKSG